MLSHYTYFNQQIIAIHIPGVTDRNPQQQQHQQQINSSRGGNINQNQLNKNTHQNNNINNSNNNYKVVDRDYNNESKNNNDGRSIPVNIDDLPVGKGNSSSDQASKGGSGSGSGNYGNDSNADSRFSSSNNNKNNRKSSPRGGGRGDYHDDNTISSPVHGQNSEVTYSTRDDRKDKGEADQSKSRNSKIKDNGSYDAKDSFSGSNDALRYVRKMLKKFVLRILLEDVREGWRSKVVINDSCCYVKHLVIWVILSQYTALDFKIIHYNTTQHTH